jgi:hypothetical protein
MVVGRFGKMSAVAVAVLSLNGLSGVGSAGAVQQTRVAYSIEFAEPGESGDPEPYGAVVLRLADGRLPYWGHYEPYVIEGQDGHVTVNIYGIG